MKKSNYYMNQQRPISIKEMPYTIDLRALLAYAKAKGIAVLDLSEEEKQQFLIPNSQYRADLAYSANLR